MAPGPGPALEDGVLAHGLKCSFNMATLIQHITVTNCTYTPPVGGAMPLPATVVKQVEIIYLLMMKPGQNVSILEKRDTGSGNRQFHNVWTEK